MQYASLFFIVGVDSSDAENELGILEFIHCLVETLVSRHLQLLILIYRYVLCVISRKSNRAGTCTCVLKSTAFKTSNKSLCLQAM
jgi:Clathrin adaptor complex small chain